MIRCLSCFNEFDGEGPCPFCGKDEVKQVEPMDLMPGTVLAGRYLISESVGTGGFGIIYRAFDLKFETIIAVKEYYPRRIVTRAAGTKDIIVSTKGREEYAYRKKRFLAEARNMAKLGDHKNIPNVFEYFEENNTAYIVMEFLEGMSLSEMLNAPDYKPDQDFAIFVTNEIGNALMSLHKFGILHRDVAPDNIFISSDRELKIKLLDLGAARLADDDDDVIDIVLKPGYSPIEQYIDDKKSRKGIDERADIYALGATLYHLLTGVKPEESSNRKIADEVLPPNQINPDIDSNLSNSVMKAMALEKHLRFGSVKEFLSAINGNRKVVELKTERKHRKIKQVLLIAMSLLIVAAAAVTLNFYYASKKSVEFLPDATLTIWYISDEQGYKDEAMRWMVEDFNKAYENVTIELQSFPEDEYYVALDEAAANGEMPDLFESTRASDEVLSKANNLNKVLSSEQAADCLFLDQYDSYYSDRKKLPLAIDVPMVCVITNGTTKVDYDKDTFGSLADFNTDVISLDERADYLAHKNFDYDSYAPMDEFMNNEANTSAVLVTSTMSVNTIRDLTAYSKKCVYPESETIYCRFTYEWSICSSDSDEVECAERLLSWMLGENYQNMLMIGFGGIGEIPINKNAYISRISSSEESTTEEAAGKATNYYVGLENDAYTRFVFVNEDNTEG